MADCKVQTGKFAKILILKSSDEILQLPSAIWTIEALLSFQSLFLKNIKTNT